MTGGFFTTEPPGKPLRERIRVCVLSGSVVSDSCDLMDCSLPCYSVPGVVQAKILEWVAILYFNKIN